VIQTTTLAVAGMACGMCERHVRRALEGMSGVVDVDVSLSGQPGRHSPFIAQVRHIEPHCGAARRGLPRNGDSAQSLNSWNAGRTT
jgi:copper chaperone CopZ